MKPFPNIERESTSFTVGIVGTSTTTSTTGTGLLDPLILGGIAMGGLLIVIVAVFVLRKR